MDNGIKKRLIGNNIIILILLSVTAFTIYSGSLNSSFHFDDKRNILENPDITINELSLFNLKKAALTDATTFRPVSFISFALNYYISGTNTVSYHIVNIVIHILIAFLIYLIILTLFDYESADEKMREHIFISAIFTALIWLCSPLNSQAVIYIVQRMTQLMTFFFLLSFYAYIIGRKRKNAKYFVLSAVFFALSIFSKQNGVMLPAVLVLYELIFIKKGEVSKFSRNEIFLASGLSLFFIITLLFYKSEIYKIITVGYHMRDFTMTERMLTQFRVLVFYLSLLILPLPGRLSICHNIIKSTSLFNPITTLFSLILLLFLLVFAILRLKKYPYVSFAILWFFITNLVESTFIPLEMAYEHRTYLPCIFLMGLFSDFVINKLYDKYKLPAVSLLLAITVIFSSMTIIRSRVWKDDVTLWEDTKKKYPDYGRALVNLGVAYSNQSRYKEAEPNYLSAIKVTNKPYLLVTAYNNLGLIKSAYGEYDTAEKYYDKALQLRKDAPQPYIGLGDIYYNKGNYYKALEMYKKANMLGPELLKPYRMVGLTYYVLNDYENALKYFNRAIELNPDFFMVYNDLGILYRDKRDYKKALYYFKKAFSINPGDPIVKKNITDTKRMMGR